MATATHKIQRLIFNLANQKLIDFLDELQNLGKKRNRSCCPSEYWTILVCQNAPTWINRLTRLIWRMAPTNRLCRILNDGMKELELNGMKALDEMQTAVYHSHKNVIMWSQLWRYWCYTYDVQFTLCFADFCSLMQGTQRNIKYVKGRLLSYRPKDLWSILSFF